jgi:CheY-like chemotaxis protein
MFVDKRANRELMTYLLNTFGHAVLAAEDGHQGLEAARREHADLFARDARLSDIDDFEVAHWLKSDPELCTRPLVAVTALALAGDRCRLLAAGFDGYLTSPINPETFV